MIDIKIFKTEFLMTQRAIKILKMELKKKGRLSVAFSGGKTPIHFFKLLALEGINWDNIDIFLVDERWVPLEHKDSNYSLINKLLLQNIPIPKENIHMIKHLSSIENSKNKYEEELLEYFKENIVFDLIFLGVGSDGHTASIFEVDEVNCIDNIIVTSSHRHPHNRISLGMKIINNAKRKIFLLGPNKLSVIEPVISNDTPLSRVTNSEFLSYLK